MAGGEGFEPPVELPPRQFSRLVHSTALPPAHGYFGLHARISIFQRPCKSVFLQSQKKTASTCVDISTVMLLWVVNELETLKIGEALALLSNVDLKVFV